MQDELLDIVNEGDEVIGTIRRSEYPRLIRDNLGYIRAAELFIVNSAGKVWVPVRTADKRIAPNGYDYSAAGHVESGEAYVYSMLRETEEELNLSLDPEDIELIAKTGPDDKNYFNSVYMYRSDETPAYNPNDFVRASWMSPQELVSAIDAGHPAKSNLRDAVLRLQAYLTERG